MGKSLPPPAAIDLVGSYARLRGGDAEVVLWEPKLTAESGTLVFTKGSSSVQGQAGLVTDDDGRRIVARTARNRLSDGIWTLVLRSGAAEDPDNEPVDARLLVQGDRPLVLLWGEKTMPSEVPGPRRRSATPRSAAPHTAASPRKQAAARAGAMLDRALTVLPPERAKKVRAGIRRTARKVLK